MYQIRMSVLSITYLKTAVRLVVLVQPSSAFIERVFSRLRLILETTQQHVLQDSILLRLLVTINSKYYIDDELIEISDD